MLVNKFKLVIMLTVPKIKMLVVHCSDTEDNKNQKSNHNHATNSSIDQEGSTNLGKMPPPPLLRR